MTEEQVEGRTPTSDPDSENSPAPLTDLVIIVPHMGPGGAQRVVSLLARHWHEAGWRLHLITLYLAKDAFPLPEGIGRSGYVPSPRGWWRSLQHSAYVAIESRLTVGQARSGKSGFFGTALRFLRWMRAARAAVYLWIRGERIPKQPAAWLREQLESLRPRGIVSFVGSTNIITVVATQELDLPLIISERNDPARQTLNSPWENARIRLYGEADRVTANSSGALTTMRQYVAPEKLRQVHNPLRVPECPSDLARHGKRLVFLGRLVSQKAPEILIGGFGKVAKRLPDWHLDIVGDGEMRRALEAVVANLGITSQVTFHGHQSDVFPVLFRASIFVLPSRFEGMPNAMLEAMGCGLAVIVSDASPGPLEFIRDGETGLVVPVDDADALGEAIHQLGSNEELRATFQAASLQEAEKLAVPKIAGDWEAMFREVGIDLPLVSTEELPAPSDEPA